MAAGSLAVDLVAVAAAAGNITMYSIFPTALAHHTETYGAPEIHYANFSPTASFVAVSIICVIFIVGLIILFLMHQKK